MSGSTSDAAEDLAVTAWRTTLEAPEDHPFEVLDARELPPPKPLSETLERLPELDDDVVFLQVNDREPKHLFPKLEDREYRYDTTTTEGGVVTAIWRS